MRTLQKAKETRDAWAGQESDRLIQSLEHRSAEAKEPVLTTILAALEYRLEPNVHAPDLRFVASEAYWVKIP